MPKGTVCVIGSSGFVGSHVTAAFLQKGYDVRGTVRESGRHPWLESALIAGAAEGATLTLVQANPQDQASLVGALDGCSGLVNCVGLTKQEMATVDFMQAIAGTICDAALEAGVRHAVFTSSTGSTNPPGGDPVEKREMDHWSDDTEQLAVNKFAAAAKTRYDRTILARSEASNGRLRCATINPSMITGPTLGPKPNSGHRAFATILKGERMGESIPNGSMSMIDVRDLAALHVAALEKEDAEGRYFGVKRSWHWRDILAALADVVSGYTPPPWDPDVAPATPTAFDTSRRDSLGVELRDLHHMLEDMVADVKRHGLI
ncbi:MAG: NAD-dependent epimerase/dehydratase family protein [Candidatus Phaeomarinobacter sp.]|mgnify:CR=1 FL=1